GAAGGVWKSRSDVLQHVATNILYQVVLHGDLLGLPAGVLDDVDALVGLKVMWLQWQVTPGILLPRVALNLEEGVVQGLVGMEEAFGRGEVVLGLQVAT